MLTGHHCIVLYIACDRAWILTVKLFQINFISNPWIVLYSIGWSLLPNALRPFWDPLCSPNLGIRTWTCRLNFAQRPIFQDWDSLTSLKSQIQDPQPKVPPGGLVLRIFTSWKNQSTSIGFEPANLGSRGEHVTPWSPRPTNFNARKEWKFCVFLPTIKIIIRINIFYILHNLTLPD